MSKKRKKYMDSPGHKLIVELLLHLTTGAPLLTESRDTWKRVLGELLCGRNKKQATKNFFDELGLKYVEGKPERNTDTVPLLVELLLLDGCKTKTKAFEIISEFRKPSIETIRDNYYKYQSEEMREYAAILYNQDNTWQASLISGSTISPGTPELYRVMKALGLSY